MVNYVCVCLDWIGLVYIVRTLYIGSLAGSLNLALGFLALVYVVSAEIQNNKLPYFNGILIYASGTLLRLGIKYEHGTSNDNKHS